MTPVRTAHHILMLFIIGRRCNTAFGRSNDRLDAIQAIRQSDIQLRSGNSEQALLARNTAIQRVMRFTDAYRKQTDPLCAGRSTRSTLHTVQNVFRGSQKTIPWPPDRSKPGTSFSTSVHSDQYRIR